MLIIIVVLAVNELLYSYQFYTHQYSILHCIALIVTP